MSFEDIKSITQNFSDANKVGTGGFGNVYKGHITHGHGKGYNTIVAKKLDTSNGQGENEYYNELQILYEYKHENVIGLVGYSNETNEKLIVYEYASNGSLYGHLSNESLTWRNRLNICIDVVTGMDFLHGGIRGKEVVIHRDIKSDNILLFDDWKAKIGDFGLSLISTINTNTKVTIARACGTAGYVDPLYKGSGILTKESDIYSLGVVLLEILYGRQISKCPKSTTCWSRFIKRIIKKRKAYSMVFKDIKEEVLLESLETFLVIVSICLDDDRDKRPTSKEVLAQLKKALYFQHTRGLRQARPCPRPALPTTESSSDAIGTNHPPPRKDVKDEKDALDRRFLQLNQCDAKDEKDAFEVSTVKISATHKLEIRNSRLRDVSFGPKFSNNKTVNFQILPRGCEILPRGREVHCSSSILVEQFNLHLFTF
ncbi:probable serine/threonine-protein kinase PBL28 [Rutidosis leptorrhynchoides]|uniref:probable serine/threonine-protein kinase PBL28 n=1 Tax=Rutidosis leptorrhynchoides TaxID=125765 RepID=UPI003A995840